ncbi:dual oxidase maturation factor 1 [Pelobates fuscus]|uniref:dual oxidase maturation factor 1 n=1 Tax=Pelobates fuscus TaxID=191477 RepID=UPI002FE4DF3A
MYFNSFPFYPQTRKPYIYDTSIAEIIIICSVTACTFIIILPGIRGKLRLFWLLRVLTSLLIGAVILAVNFTRDWEVGMVTTTTVYKSFSKEMVNVSIGLWVGLKGINITLSGIPLHQINETINYNEIFDWETGEKFDKEYAEGLERGLPNPILYVAEKFTSGSPGRLYEQYSIGSHYASALMWLAFCSWIFCNVLFSMLLLQYGIYMMISTSLCVIISLISFVSFRQEACSIIFGISVLQPTLGLSFWLSLGAGILCLMLSLILIVLHIRKPTILKRVFNDIDAAKKISESEEVLFLDDNQTIMLQQML